MNGPWSNNGSSTQIKIHMLTVLNKTHLSSVILLYIKAVCHVKNEISMFSYLWPKQDFGSQNKILAVV